LQSLYFALLFSRVTESSHLDAAEQTDLPITIRSASESSLMRRQNSSPSNRVDATADFTARIRKAKVQEAVQSRKHSFISKKPSAWRSLLALVPAELRSDAGVGLVHY
jgi:hypothetical protein